MDEPWIGITFVIAIVLGGLQGAYFVPTDKKLAALAEKELADGATTLSEDYQRQAQREGGIGALAGLPDHRRRLPDGDEAGLALTGSRAASAVSSAAGIGRPIRKPWP